MRALVVSDIHGNLQALQAVLAAAGSFDELWNLGDTVGYGANPNEVIDTIRPLARINVRGNHDRVCCGLTSSQGFNPIAAEAAAWTHRNLTPANLAWLRAMPQGPVLASERALCAHGSPLNEDHYIISMRDAWSPLQRMSTEITFFGHTHVQGAFSQHAPEWQEIRPIYNTQSEPEQFSIDVPVGSRHLINPGSVGQPRDADWRAGFAIYDTAADRVTFFRIPYDVAGAQQAIRNAHLPERLASRLRAGR
ncbi:MAG TPA: metallophosphoesterase family protein [Acidobacteriaceae bacterium]|nr:metallophosphoesterase family protein [Acidobacteriaceae bacterium]